MRVTFHIFFVIVTVAMVSCGPSQEDQARAKLNQAQSLLAANDTAAALRHLDSIPRLYPEAAYAVNAANNLAQEVNFELLHRKEAELDSLNAKIAELEKPFTKEKTEFDRYTQYIHDRQTFDRAWDRSYIQVHLDERGELYLSSNYHGENWLNHTALRVYDQGDDAKTDEVPVGNIDNHRSDFSEAVWEKVTYREGKADSVLHFIANNTDRNLKAVFLGDEYYYIILETYDKQAVKDALALSNALKRRTNLQREVTNLQDRLQIN